MAHCGLDRSRYPALAHLSIRLRSHPVGDRKSSLCLPLVLISTFYQIEKSPCWRPLRNFLESKLLSSSFYQIEKSPCWRPTIEDSDSNPQSNWTFYQIEKSPCWRLLILLKTQKLQAIVPLSIRLRSHPVGDLQVTGLRLSTFFLSDWEVTLLATPGEIWFCAIILILSIRLRSHPVGDSPLL